MRAEDEKLLRALEHIARNAENIVKCDKSWRSNGRQEYRIAFVNKTETDGYTRKIEEGSD